MRPGMYIGKLGDGSAADDGIYVLLKEAPITLLMNLSWVQETVLRSQLRTDV